MVQGTAGQGWLGFRAQTKLLRRLVQYVRQVGVEVDRRTRGEAQSLTVHVQDANPRCRGHGSR